MLIRAQSVILLLYVLSLFVTQTNGVKAPSTRMEKFNDKMKKMIAYSTSKEYSETYAKVEARGERNYDFAAGELVERQGASPIVNPSTQAFSALECSSVDLCWGIGQGVLYKSTDAMLSWDTVSAPFLLRTIILTADPNYVMVMGYNASRVITTTDGGDTWNTYTINVIPDHIRVHPTDANYMMVFNIRDYGLYITSDFAQTWTKFQDGTVYDLAWCNPGNGGRSSYDVCFITTGTQDGPAKNGKTLFYQADIDKTWIKAPLANAAYYLIEHPRYLFVLGASTDGAGANIFVSTDNGTTFNEAVLPHEDHIPIIEPSQLLSDRFELFLASTWDSNTGGVRQGSIYVADGNALVFSEILGDAVSMNNWWDFESIRSVEGCHIANHFVGYISPREYYLQTLITYDNGANWERLTPPTKTYNGSNVFCNPESPGETCSLNLFGLTTWLGIGGNGNFGNVYSGAPTTAGMVMGTGNIGDHLSMEADEVRTYVSNNAGESWREVFGVSTIYDYGDHGSLLVAAPNNGVTNTLYYSLDLGYTWTSFQFASQMVHVINIFTVDEGKNIFTLFCQRNGNYYYYSMDFTPVVPTRACQDSDYTIWELQDSHGVNCYLGHNTWYKLRNNGSVCDNPYNFNPIAQQQNCDCTDQDYECDTGFFPTSIDSNKCAAYADMEPRVLSECFPNGTQWVSGGYRKAAGDTCINDLPNKLRVLHSCAYVATGYYTTGTTGRRPSSTGGSTTGSSETGNPTSHSSGKAIAAVVVTMIIVIIVAAVALIVFGRKNEFLREKLPFLAYFDRSNTVRYNQLNLDDEEEQ